MPDLPRPISIVIVDPHPGDYAALLRTADRQLSAAHLLTTGERLLRLPIRKADLWLINVALPDLSGAELCRQLRPRLYGQSVLLVGDTYAAEDERAAMQTGGVHYVCKPIEAALLEWLLPLDAATRRPHAGRLSLAGSHPS